MKPPEGRTFNKRRGDAKRAYTPPFRRTENAREKFQRISKNLRENPETPETSPVRPPMQPATR
jgi:hypothetical protein